MGANYYLLYLESALCATVVTFLFLRYLSSVIACSSTTNRLVTAKDHAAVQLNVGKVDDKGRLTGEVETFALCGFIRGKGLGDDALNRLVRERGLLNDLAPAEE